MSEQSSPTARCVKSTDVFARARELQVKAAEQETLADGADNQPKRQFHSSAAKAYSSWATQLEKTAETLEIIEQRIEIASDNFSRTRTPDKTRCVTRE